MSGASRVRCPQASVAKVTIVAIGVLVLAAAGLGADSGSAGPLAQSCGVPPAAASGGQAGGVREPQFPPGQYPVKLPPVSLLGAHNDFPNPYRPGVSWGQLPEGRRWGSTASITTAPDGTLWVVDRCGVSGAGGTTCAGANASVNPIFQFDPSGKLLKAFGAGMFVSPHKLSVDKQGNLWLADNGGHQVFKLNQDGKVLLTLGKKGVAGPDLDEFDAPTDVAIAPNGDIFVGDRQNNRIQIFDQDGKFIAQWFQFGRPSGMYIDKSDVIYVADSESRDGRTNTGQFALPQTGYAYNLGAQRGIRIGSATDGSVKYFIPDPCPYPYAAGSSLAEGVTTDFEGNVYGADFLGDVRKFVK